MRRSRLLMQALERLMRFDRFNFPWTIRRMNWRKCEPRRRKLCLGQARLGEGRIDEAIQLLMNDPNPQSLGFLGYAYARSGRRQEAEKLLAGDSPPANEQALIFAGLRDQPRTLEALNRMAALGAQRVGMYLNSFELASVQGDPALGALRKKVGLPD